MRLTGFGIREASPIKLVETSDLSSVVVLAGPNGVGKTRINESLLQFGRDPRADPNRWMQVEATDEVEIQQWSKRILDTRNASDAALLSKTLRRSQRRNRYRSSFLNFDSDRAVRNVQTYGFSWDVRNPFDEEIGWEMGFTPLHDRYNDVRHSLFRLVESQRRAVSDKAFELRVSGASTMALDFPDILAPFKEAFWQLLAPKKLVEVSARHQQIFYEYEGKKLPVESLSSGEREVVNIVFDFILRNPEHSVILFDEPELHLHPELSYKLLQALAHIGRNNQFIFSSHSPDIISASLEHTVLFITPPKDANYNQALRVRQDDETHHALQALGQSIGVISLGKKLILIEGNEASLDKQTYGSILKGRFPEFVLVPVGGKDTTRSFEDIKDSVLNKTIWGVEFFLLSDRDAVIGLGKDALSATISSRMKQLPRYHLENYFLEESVIAEAFASAEPPESWLRDPSKIRLKLREIARSVVGYAVALNVSSEIRRNVGNISIMPKNAANAQNAGALMVAMLPRVQEELKRVAAGMNEEILGQLIQTEFDRLTNAIDQDTDLWKVDIPGRILLNKFAGTAQIQPGRLKQMYLAAANPDVTFGDIIKIFEDFRRSSPLTQQSAAPPNTPSPTAPPTASPSG